jgi:hypothetical protein
MLAAVLTGHVRRVVFDAAGVVIDLGRRSRLFTGSSSDAVMLGDRWCLWPGCDQRSGRCQADHTQPWTATDRPAPTTVAPRAPATTVGNSNAVSEPSATRRDAGTPTDPTAAKSAPSPTRPIPRPEFDSSSSPAARSSS